VGVAAGMGHETTAVITTLLALFILAALKRFAHRRREASARLDKRIIPAAPDLTESAKTGER